MGHQKHLLKICIVGDGGVGKTTILHRYVDDMFIEDTKVTIGTNLFVKRIELAKEDSTITLQIWDLGGQERFFAFRPNFYTGAQGIIYTFDLTNRFSYINLKNWYEEINRVIGPVPSILLGNKLDLVLKNGARAISKEEGLSILNDIDSFEYLETSAKDGTGINKAFQIISKKIHSTLIKIP